MLSLASLLPHLLLLRLPELPLRHLPQCHPRHARRERSLLCRREPPLRGLFIGGLHQNIILKDACLNRGWQDAMKMFDEMLQLKVLHTLVTYNTLIGFLYKSENLEHAGLA
ncbi:hypothetical protein QJS10_CPB17g00763 [Acorus calamus]|uniref:Pentatricopeptide repeat-containing protein n=1 Tax=Acorus calamus TaxID=4465 RepID=A0AAV9CS12_ACOCL|nr:hypothetical protein QJS10_CPB17g00763 [Acorus calamus]